MSRQFTGWDINGKMNKKLLSRTTNYLLVFSGLVLLVSAPAFYYMADALYLGETDETLGLRKDEFIKTELPGLKISEIDQWNKYNRNIQIIPSRNLEKQVVFDTVYYDKIENEQEPYRELDAPIFVERKPFTYSGKVNLIETRNIVKSMAIMFSVVLAVLLVGMLLITNILSKKIWKPFYKTLMQIQGFEIDKKRTIHFGDTDVDEFAQLNRSLSQLIRRNTDIYNSQKEFIENAAHELQTPLAIFQAKIDNLFQMNTSDEQSRLLSSLNDDVARLNRLNKNLLLLSKIGNATERYLEKQPIRIDEYLTKRLVFFTEQAKSKNIAIVTQIAQSIEVGCNPDLADVMINNLFLNAIRHNVENGKIMVSVAHNRLIFSNTGPAKALDGEKIFNRFSKSGDSFHGNGLGLAIVKKIAEVNSWEISYAFDDQLHCFTIKFR